jgi:hypothetical protein
VTFSELDTLPLNWVEENRADLPVDATALVHDAVD